MSNKFRLLSIDECVLPRPFIIDLLRCCGDCSDSLQMLKLKRMKLSPFEPFLNELLGKLAAHHETGGAQRKLRLLLGGSKKHSTCLSKKFEDEWTKRCRGIPSIYFDIDNDLYDSDSSDSDTEDDDDESGGDDGSDDDDDDGDESDDDDDDESDESDDDDQGGDDDGDDDDDESGGGEDDDESTHLDQDH